MVTFDAASADVIDAFPDSSRLTLAAELEAMKNGHRLTHRLLNSRRPVYGARASLSTQAPMCDVVLLAQILSHQRDPLWALQQAARVASETLIIVEPCFRAKTPRVMFLGHRDHRSWWLMTDRLYREWLKTLGFELQRATRAKYRCNVAGEVDKKAIWTFVARRLH